MKRIFAMFFAVAGALSLSSLTGCGKPEAPQGDGSGAVAEAEHDHEHDHPSEGPHHGHLIELGQDEYHLELTHDDATKTVAIYVLDAAAEKSVPINEKELTISLVVDGKPAQYTLPAAPQADDPEGKSSSFSLADESLCDGWDAKGATGRISLTINDKPYSGKIDHHAHGEHEH